MSKAILVIDMPNNCHECPLRRESRIIPYPEVKDFVYNVECMGLNDWRGKETTMKTRPNWCPLQAMPECY